MFVMPRACPDCGAAGGEPHVQPCSFQQRYEAARGPLFEWIASLPAEYERLKARADRQALGAVLRRGDVLLSAGNTRCAALVRRLTQSTWSHVSMYVGPLDDAPDPLCIDLPDGRDDLLGKSPAPTTSSLVRCFHRLP